MTPAPWLVLTVRVPSPELSDELAEGLVALGGSAVQEEGDRLTTYVPAPADPESFRRAAAGALAAIAGEAVELTWGEQADQDWSVRWKEGLAPRAVGPRITVTQPWHPVEETGDGIVIVIDPATAFGTGEHPTTRGALRLLQAHVRGGERVLDVGAGSGILSIAAVRLGTGPVLGAESDAGSMDTARENLERNGVADGIRLVHQRVTPDWLEDVAAEEGGAGFDLIVANVLSGILVPLLPAFARALTPEGRVVLGGILDTEADDVVAAAAGAGLVLVEPDREGEWWTGLFRRAPDGAEAGPGR